ncbi:hypothetical protein B566_EDAN006993, partial [Ephemera danica]
MYYAQCGPMVENTIMTNITYFKYVLLALLFITTTTVIFYVSSISQMDSQPEQTAQPLVYRVRKEEGKIVLTRMIDIERQAHLQNTCKKEEQLLDDSLPVEENFELLGHIIVDEAHKLLYCYVPKVACTNWKRVFMILQQKTNATDVASIPASLAHSQGMFMKHPFERLLSAYRNKLEQHYESSKYFQQRYGRYIVKQYRPNASQEALDKGDDVSFKEFSSFLTDKNAVFNEHWKPIQQLCRPCLINYDIIGKYETLQEDAEFVLRHIGQSQIQFPKLPKPSSTMSRLQEYFGTLPKDVMLELQRIYALDFKLFGYDTFNENETE